MFANLIRSIPLLHLFFIEFDKLILIVFLTLQKHLCKLLNNYDPLTGSLDINELEKKILEIIKLNKSNKKKYEKNYDSNLISKFFFSSQNSNFSKYNLFNLALHETVAWCCRQYPRYLDRVTIVKQCMEVSSKIALAGHNWDKYGYFKSMYKGSLNNYYQLIEFYNNCKINICNNTTVAIY